MGKLGGREMTATSDLDLIVIYDADQERDHLDGASRSPSRNTMPASPSA